MLKFFRFISVLEGISYLIILSVAFELISREYVYLFGMGHGVLYLLYLVLSLIVCNNEKWSVLIWIALLIAAVIPFAFIPVEYFLKKHQFKSNVD